MNPLHKAHAGPSGRNTGVSVSPINPPGFNPCVAFYVLRGGVEWGGGEGGGGNFLKRSQCGCAPGSLEAAPWDPSGTSPSDRRDKETTLNPSPVGCEIEPHKVPRLVFAQIRRQASGAARRLRGKRRVIMQAVAQLQMNRHCQNTGKDSGVPLRAGPDRRPYLQGNRPLEPSQACPGV
ncbi:hypothetical protein SKAU_G00039500 [Synaphobranchus kaupii]|uniref:Uncharacterized protein n=1 Tax=Synaphobranchus kaupii TaxID=118154 RepID=A0A9Q1JHI3_SYNKA|nr:hypothetical protein SKAU_G00039500 [Synaphobranchus kaupii]